MKADCLISYMYCRICKSDPDTSTSLTSDNDGVYERPLGAYSSEEILKILLNPKINPKKICRIRPSYIVQSVTYVVDLDCLDHPDDIMNLGNGTTVVHMLPTTKHLTMS